MRSMKYFFLLVLSGLLAAAANPSDSASNITVTQAMQESLKKQRDSLEKQRQAIHRQSAGQEPAARNSVAEFIDPIPDRIQADCPALASETVASLIATAAKKQSLQAELLHAVMKQESAFKPCAVSIKGAQGLMQLMPATARELHIDDVFDPEQNVQAGAAYLKQLLGRYNGDLRLALIAYNAGPGRADQPTGQPYPLETQNYVANIFAELGISQWEGNSSDSAPLEEVSEQQAGEMTAEQPDPAKDQAAKQQQLSQPVADAVPAKPAKP